MNTTKSLILAIIAVALSACVVADPVATSQRTVGNYSSEEADFTLVQMVADLDHPWAFAFLPDGDILITERPGTLWRYDGEQLVAVSDLPAVAASGQGGMLDVALHPDYGRTGWIYLSYSAPYDGGFGTVVSRFRLDSARAVDTEEIFRMSNPDRSGRHFGSRLAFDGDGYLYITIGDRGSQDRAQDLNDHPGSVIRLHDDGSVPEDNPFVSQGGALPEIYSYGHRNAQGMALNPFTGEIWLHEHGPQGGDEINVVRSGDNHGWPVITYGVNYGTGTQIGEGTEMPGMEQPVTYWVPSIAPSGMAFYTGESFPGWQGDLFVGALAGEHLRRVEIDGDIVVEQEVLLQGQVGRIRDVRQGPDGALYFITDEDQGGLYRLEPTR